MEDMTDVTPRAVLRSHARSNRARILEAARREFARDPDASLEEIARAAGVVRRTLYGHFANRQALVAALAEEAGRALAEAFTGVRRPGEDPATAMARMTMAAWKVGDRYRMLISLGRRDLGEERVRDVLTPARTEVTAFLTQGQRDGIFGTHLPPEVLAEAVEALLLTLVEKSVTAETAATAALVAAGVTPAKAALVAAGVVPERDDGGDLPPA
jgi:AcrR family transcriptional regulator